MNQDESKIGMEENRFSDDAIYLNEDRYETPKEIFKFIASLMEKNLSKTGSKILDVGCATGELIYYLKKRFNTLNFTGIDVSEKMIHKAKIKMPSETFICTNILAQPLNSSIIGTQKFDFIICSGVLSIFDDLELPLNNLLSCLNPGGFLYIESAFNKEPVDVILRYRTTTQGNSPWESGWNVFSVNTAENILKKFGIKEWNWFDFRMPFDILKVNDPMRTWTIKTEDNPFQLINGAAQLVDLMVLEVKKPNDNYNCIVY